MNDFELLRQYEPVLRFTQGELFFPCAVDGYVRDCSLIERDADGNETILVESPGLDLRALARFDAIRPGHMFYLRFVKNPLNSLDYQRWYYREDKPSFQAPGRLARVGLLARFIDSFLDISLLIRGRVPGGTSAAAEQQYRRLKSQDPRLVYYGRVIREGGYIVLHYLFFYIMNNWRSGFYGVNDHEADWEQVFVYLSDAPDGDPAPCWVAYASHDFSGDNLRRHWDDPELEKAAGTHPVVYVAAGSHASYFRGGEYLMSLQPQFLTPVRNLARAARKLWTERLGQGDTETLGRKIEAAMSVPFVDYARGDGLTIGPGQMQFWSPILLEDTPEFAWVHQYRGLWGLDTKDLLGGERAPSGPKYNRDGSVRQSWYNPLGWAGLHKVAPPRDAAAALAARQQALGEQIKALTNEIAGRRTALRLLELEVRALADSNYLTKQVRLRREQMADEERQLDALIQRRTEALETLEACRTYSDALKAGKTSDLQGHIHFKHVPQPPAPRQNRVVEFWAAISTSLLLLTLALLLFFDPSRQVIWSLGVAAVFVTIESAVRGRLGDLLLSVIIALAVITAGILFVEFFWLLILLGVLRITRVLITENLRELRSSKAAESKRG